MQSVRVLNGSFVTQKRRTTVVRVEAQWRFIAHLIVQHEMLPRQRWANDHATGWEEDLCCSLVVLLCCAVVCPGLSPVRLSFPRHQSSPRADANASPAVRPPRSPARASITPDSMRVQQHRHRGSTHGPVAAAAAPSPQARARVDTRAPQPAGSAGRPPSPLRSPSPIQQGRYGADAAPQGAGADSRGGSRGGRGRRFVVYSDSEEEAGGEDVWQEEAPKPGAPVYIDGKKHRPSLTSKDSGRVECDAGG
jgi:hypothetical protein